LTCAKHFPGHGSSAADTHHDLGDLTATWREEELVPFKEILSGEAPADMVMTAHLFNKKWDENYPATLSPKILKDYLRGQLGFQGVVVSDDLHMGSILKNYGFEEAIVLAVNAGVD